MFKVNRWILLGCFIFSACQPPKQATVSIQEPRLWEVAYPPALSWLEPAMNGCTLLMPGYGLVVNQKPYSSLIPGEADITLAWGSPNTWPGNTYILGYDELVLIVNLQNPQQLLNPVQLSHIFNGEIKSWGEIKSGDPDEEKIEVWEYPPGNEIRSFFFSILGTSPQNPEALLAPDPSAMLQAVASNPNSIGYVPKRWASEIVKSIPIEGLEDILLRQPIVANTESEADEDIKKWLLCLQQSIQGN